MMSGRVLHHRPPPLDGIPPLASLALVRPNSWTPVQFFQQEVPRRRGILPIQVKPLSPWKTTPPPFFRISSRGGGGLQQRKMTRRQGESSWVASDVRLFVYFSGPPNSLAPVAPSCYRFYFNVC